MFVLIRTTNFCVEETAGLIYSVVEAPSTLSTNTVIHHVQLTTVLLNPPLMSRFVNYSRATLVSVSYQSIMYPNICEGEINISLFTLT